MSAAGIGAGVAPVGGSPVHITLRKLTMVALSAALAACGPSGNGGGIVTVTPTPTPGAAISQNDAVRLAKQATFGPTTAVVDRITTLGLDGWLNEQFTTSGSNYRDIAANTNVRGDYCDINTTITQCYRNYFTREPVAMRFYADAMVAPDQLRQRVAFALSQLVVTSELEVQSTAGIAAYQQVMLDNAFGNYRDILQTVSLNGLMGNYLDMADSNKSAPSENYAREMLQLFSMGPDSLNMNGTPKLDGTGATVPNYTTDDIKAVARALTGWTYARLGGAPTSDGNAKDYVAPMITVASRYDTAAKTFFGTTIPAGTSQADSVRLTVDAAFNHPSTAPYVSKFLITQLVTPNPTPAYVGRVAAVFADNGKGVRGDLKAVVRAILTDTEARGDVRAGAADGKVKEPILTMTSVMRVVGMTTDGYAFVTQDGNLGEGVFRSPSVFNFYPPDYPLPGNVSLRSPASKLVTTTNVLRLHNLIYNWTVSGDQNRGEFANNSSIPGGTGSATVWTAWEAFGTDSDGMIARINLLMFANQMTDAQKTALKAAATAITNATPSLQARRRAQMMLYIVATSPGFLVDR